MGSNTGMWTLAQRETSRFMRVWQQTIIPPIITSTLFILVFGYSLGNKINDGCHHVSIHEYLF